MGVAHFTPGQARKGLNVAISSRSRALLEAAIEKAIALLDEVDGDVDLEDSFDREVCCEDEGGQCEDEGAPEYVTCFAYDHHDQRRAMFMSPFGPEYRSVA